VCVCVCVCVFVFVHSVNMDGISANKMKDFPDWYKQVCVRGKVTEERRGGEEKRGEKYGYIEPGLTSVK